MVVGLIDLAILVGLKRFAPRLPADIVVVTTGLQKLLPVLAWSCSRSSSAPMFGPSLGLPTWLLNLSPFTHVPNAPAAAVTLAPVLSLGLACVLLAVAGVVGLRRRNLALPA